MTRRPGILIATAAVLLALTSAGCSDPAPDEVAPTPTATVTVTDTVTGTATPDGDVTPTPSPTPSPTAADGADLSQPPTTYAEATAHVDAARDVTPAGPDLPVFTSPSGNIFCDLEVPACEITDGAVDDPAACPDAPTTRVGRLELQGNEPVAVCNTDTIVQPDVPQLTYGTSVTTRDTRCVSEEIGMTCVARGAETGFFLAQGRYVLITS